MTSLSPRGAYYREAFETALDEAGLWSLVEQMTDAQRQDIGEALAGSAECESQAFYSPPASDRISVIESEWKRKLDALQREFDAYRNGSEIAIRRALRQFPDERVSISNDGSVYRHGGRTEQIL